jgi:hypothetical protein
MSYPSVKDVALYWIPETDKVSVHPLRGGRDKSLSEYSDFGVYVKVHEMNHEQLKTHAFIMAMHLIIRDRCCPDAVHKALLGVAEYRDGLSDDMPGLVLPR